MPSKRRPSRAGVTLASAQAMLTLSPIGRQTAALRLFCVRDG